jgi:hypothetical protein
VSSHVQTGLLVEEHIDINNFAHPSFADGFLLVLLLAFAQTPLPYLSPGEVTGLCIEIFVVPSQLTIWPFIAVMWSFAFPLPVPDSLTKPTHIAHTLCGLIFTQCALAVLSTFLFGCFSFILNSCDCDGLGIT